MTVRTRVFQIDENNIDLELIKEAADIIKRGGTVVFPTETVYGIGADAFNEQAAARIFEAKGRPSDNPLIVHISDMGMLDRVVRDIPDSFHILSKKFWPGPLTMVMYKKPDVPDTVTAGLNTVAVRFPSDRIAIALISLGGTPVCAPSANISGRPSSTTPDHVMDDFFGKADAIIQSSNSAVGIESTVVDLTTPYPVILRPGKITASEIAKALKTETYQSGETSVNRIPKAPGMKYRHYAPAADMTLYMGSDEAVAKCIVNDAEKLSADHKVAIMSFRPRIEYEHYHCRSLTTDGSLDEASKNIYRVLRDFDREGIEYILAEAVPCEGIGEALMNRLYKACGNKIKYL
jgi:L-threonylcarbamoyladenylate synthase